MVQHYTAPPRSLLLETARLALLRLYRKNRISQNTSVSQSFVRRKNKLGNLLPPKQNIPSSHPRWLIVLSPCLSLCLHGTPWILGSSPRGGASPTASDVGLMHLIRNTMLQLVSINLNVALTLNFKLQILFLIDYEDTLRFLPLYCCHGCSMLHV